MAISLDASSAKIVVDKKDAKTDIYAGTGSTGSALLHGTRGANKSAADSGNSQSPVSGDMIKFTGTVFLNGDPNSGKDRLDITDWKFTFVQSANVMVLAYVFAGRRENEGSITANYRKAFQTHNPSFDCPDNMQPTFDDAFDNAVTIVDNVRGARPGFKVTVMGGDHVTQMMSLRWQNRTASATNFLFSARLDEGFVTYLVGREPGGTIRFLSRVGWHAIWHGEFRWTTGNQVPRVIMKHSRLDVGTVLSGPPDASDAHFQVARQPAAPTANDLNDDAIAQFKNRRAPVYSETARRPADIPADFFT